MQWLLAMLLVCIGCFIQSSIGFGLAIVSAPFLMHISQQFIPGPIVFVAFFLSLVNALRFKQNISLSGLGFALIGRVPGSVCGAWLLLMISSAHLSLMVGLLVIFAVGMSLLPVHIKPTPIRLGIGGFFSGLFGTSSSIGGPPMALLFQHEEANAIRANLSAFFLVGSFISLLILTGAGKFTLNQLWLSTSLLPAAGLGYWVAMRSINKLSPRIIRAASLLLCACAGAYAIASAIT